MKELVTYLAKSLVDIPEEVSVAEVEGEKTTVLELKVAQTDLGKIIGKQGRTARAMRVILNAAATKLKKRAVLEIIEPEGSRREFHSRNRDDRDDRGGGDRDRGYNRDDRGGGDRDRGHNRDDRGGGDRGHSRDDRGRDKDDDLF